MKIYTADELPQHLDDATANPDWLAIRAGKFTGSDFFQYMSYLKKGELSDTAESSLYKKVLEYLGESVADGYKSAAMERGNELEPIARAEYIGETFNDVKEVGFVDLEQLHAGCSPDGMIIPEPIRDAKTGAYLFKDRVDYTKPIKIIEIKCPEIKNYLKMAKGDIPENYMVQCQYNMFVTGAKSCDFVIYHPDMRLIVHKIDADEQYQEKIRTVLKYLNKRYDEIIDEIKKYKK